MAEWTDQMGAVPQEAAPDAAATPEGASATPEVSADPNEGLKAQMHMMQNQMQAMQSMYQNQMQMMQANSGAQRQVAPQAPPPIIVPPSLNKLDEDDPYRQAMVGLAQNSQDDVATLKSQLEQMQKQVYDMNVSMSRQGVQEQVDRAIEKHKVPEMMAHDVRTTAYAYLASAPPGQQVSVDAMVNRFMQSLGQYAESARTTWAEEASKPRPMTAIASSPGVPSEQPKNFDEAKERSLAMMRAMFATR